MLPISELPDKDDFVSKYFEAIIAQIDYYAEIFPDEEIKTIYFGGGTPLCLSKDNLKKIINHIQNKFNLEYLEEISFELNPVPYDETLDFIKDINNTYKNFYRIRYSIGIQSFDDDVLKSAGRDYYFNYLMMFLREIQRIKQINNVFNFDFIAFGKFNKNKQGQQILWDQKRVDFFDKFVASNFADSFSLYTLELFAGSFWFDIQNQTLKDEQIQENIYAEFEYLKTILQDYGYKRYEISNFALAGKQSLHNTVYWEMGNYIGIGVGAHSFLKGEYKDKFLSKNDLSQNCEAIRYETNKSWNEFFGGSFLNPKDIKFLDTKDCLVEKFFLGLRTSNGVQINEFENILVQDFQSKLEELQQDGFVYFDRSVLILEDKGMDVYNHIVTQLLAEI